MSDLRLAVEVVGSVQMIIVVAPKHNWARKAAISAADLLRENWVIREDGSGTRAVFAFALTEFGVDAARMRLKIVLPSNEAVRQAVEQGAGAAALSSLVCAETISAGRLVSVKENLPKRDFYAVQHVDHYRSRGVAALLSLINEKKSGQTNVFDWWRLTSLEAGIPQCSTCAVKADTASNNAAACGP